LLRNRRSNVVSRAEIRSQSKGACDNAPQCRQKAACDPGSSDAIRRQMDLWRNDRNNVSQS
jgi:hypothetical protein